MRGSNRVVHIVGCQAWYRTDDIAVERIAHINSRVITSGMPAIFDETLLFK